MSLFTIIVVAISLSLDAFSLALLYGTLNLSKKIIRNTSITVGLFHFFMPLLGYFCGDILSFFLEFNGNLLVGIIFIILSVEMFLSIFKDESVDIFTGVVSYLLFGFTVSIDSFSVGIGFGSIGTMILLPCIIFSIVSALFTFFGLLFGLKLENKFGKIATFVGSLILFFLGISYIL